MKQILQTYRNLEGKDPYIFTTEKDAMRLRKFGNIDEDIKSRMFYIPIEIEFQNEDTDSFNQQILKYVNNNKRDSILHKEQN
jgi:tetraacyldisaccharide 4'-kinase